jgi:hypothetical protein
VTLGAVYSCVYNSWASSRSLAAFNFAKTSSDSLGETVA